MDLSNVSSIRHRTPTAVIAVALAVLTAAAYVGLIHNGFVNFDDPKFITENQHVKVGLSASGIGWAFTEVGVDYWHPLTWVSHMLDVSLFGMQAGGHHLVNLALHIANTLLLFGFLRYATGRLWASALVAALFALHPLHVESVAWASERKDVLSTFFWFSTMWAYALYVRRPGLSRYAWVLVLFALGLMSKPMLVTVPVVLLLLDYWPLERFSLEGWKAKAGGVPLGRLLLEKVPLVVMAVAVAAMAILGQRRVATIAGLEDLGLSFRLTNAIVSYWRYISKMFWPEGLAALYPYPDDPLYLQAAIVSVLLVAATVTAFLVGRTRRYVLVGWLWYLVTLLPVIGILQVGPQAYADRYTYVSLVGLFIAISWLLDEALHRGLLPRVPLAACVCVAIALCTIVTWRTVDNWHDSVALCRRAISVTRDNSSMEANLGIALAAEGRLDDAMVHLQEALRIRPDTSRTLDAMGAVLAARGRYAEALDMHLRAIKANPDQYGPQYNAGVTLIKLGRAPEAVPYLRRAAELRPGWPEVFAQLGKAFAQSGNDNGAIWPLKKALELDPELWKAHIELADIYVRQQKWEDAAEQYRKALDLRTDYDSLNNLASTLVQAGKVDQAEAYYRKAITLKPDAIGAYCNLAVTLAKQGRTDEALELLGKALEVEPDNAQVRRYIDILKSGR